MIEIKSDKKYDVIIVAFLCLLALAFRSYKIDSPLIEFHSWRQADTASVARNFARDGINLLMPKYDDVSPLQTGIDNPNGYRMVEFPIYNAVIAIAYKIAPFTSIEVWGRLINILASIVILICIYTIAKIELNRFAAFIASLIYAVFPFFVFYSRAVLPETPAILLIMLATVLLIRKHNNGRVLLALCLFALSILIKPTTIFYAFVLWYLLIRNQKFCLKKYIFSAVIILLSIIPFALWRMHISQFPEGIPASQWLYTHVSTGGELKYIFFRPAFFRWIFYERINILILGSFGFVFFISGIFTRTKSLLPYALLFSSLVYMFVFQGGNVQHEYYQIIILPTLALFVGLGASYFMSNASTTISKVMSFVFIITIFGFGWYISWDKVRHYYYSLSDIPKFAKIVQMFVPPKDWIIVDTGGDTTALYAFDRKGSPGIYVGTVEMREKGYKYLFTYTHETANNLQKADPKITRLFENDRCVLLKL